MGCPSCLAKLPNSPNVQGYTIPFWDAYDKENEKWQ